jgi:hypothetical protein
MATTGRQPEPLTPAKLDRLVAAVRSAPDRPRQNKALDELVAASCRSTLVLQAFNKLAAGTGGAQLALEFTARMPLPLAYGIIILAAPHLQERDVPLPLRLAAAAKLIESLPDRRESIGPIVRSLTAGLSWSRTLKRLLQLQSRVERCDALDGLVEEMQAAVRYRCPMCRGRFTRPALARHLWMKHRLLFDHGRVQEPGPLVEAAVAKAVETRHADALDRVYLWANTLYQGVEPTQVHQAILSRVGVYPGDLEPLKQAAAEHDAGVCPACFAAVRVLVPPLPPPLTLSAGRLAGDGYLVEVIDRSAGRLLQVRGPGVELYRGPDPGQRFAPRPLAIWVALPFALLGLASAAVAPMSWAKPVTLVLWLSAFSVLLYAAVRLIRGPLPNPSDRVVDAAWREIAPRVGRSLPAVRLLTRLCRTSIGHGDPAERTEVVWELVEHAAVLAEKGGVYLQLLAAARILQAHDAAAFGRDWVHGLVTIFEPFLRGELSGSYAEAAAEVLLGTEAFGDRETARLRVLIAAAGFDAGLTPADFADLAAACSQFARLVAGGEDWLRLLYAVWKMRHTRPWEAHIGEAEPVFDFARSAPGISGRTLAAAPDTLLVYRFDGVAHDELGVVLIGRKGVTLAGVTVADPDAIVTIEKGRGSGSVLVFGPNRLAVRRRLSERVAAALKGWLRFRAERLLPAAEQADRRGVPERIRQLITRDAFDCPLCTTRAVFRTGEVGIPVPR